MAERRKKKPCWWCNAAHHQTTPRHAFELYPEDPRWRKLFGWQIDLIALKLEEIEQATKDELRILNRPTDIDELQRPFFPPSTPPPRETKAGETYRKVHALMGALLLVGKLKQRIECGDLYGAIETALMVGKHGAGQSTHAMRGVKVIRAARKGGEGRCRYREERDRVFQLTRNRDRGKRGSQRAWAAHLHDRYFPYVPFDTIRGWLKQIAKKSG
jgi:hypothetical protein